MPNRLLIRDIKKTEAIKLRRLFKKALYEDFSYFPGEYLEETNRQNTTSKLLRALISKHRILVGLFEGRKLKGYAIAGTKDPRESFIFWLYIKPEIRGSGYGKKLMSSALNEMIKKGSKNIFLITHQMEDFYKSLGFDTIYTNSSLFDDVVMYEMGIELKNDKKT